MTPPTLAPEILEIVFDELIRDLALYEEPGTTTTTLQACALASRLLLPHAYKHLFTNLSVNSTMPLSRVLSLARSAPRLMPLFNGVRIRPSKKSWEINDNRILTEVLAVAVNVQRLDLHKFHELYIFINSSVAAIRAALPRVTEVTMSRSVIDLQLMVSIFPSLQGLNIHDPLSFSDELHREFTPLANSCLALRVSLPLRGRCSCGTFYDYLLKLHGLRVHTLHLTEENSIFGLLRWTPGMRLPAFEAVQLLADSLRELRLSIEGAVDHSWICDRIKGHCPNLRSLSFVTSVPYQFKLNHLEDILPALSPSHAERLELEYWDIVCPVSVDTCHAICRLLLARGLRPPFSFCLGPWSLLHLLQLLGELRDAALVERRPRRWVDDESPTSRWTSHAFALAPAQGDVPAVQLEVEVCREMPLRRDGTWGDISPDEFGYLVFRMLASAAR